MASTGGEEGNLLRQVAGVKNPLVSYLPVHTKRVPGPKAIFFKCQGVRIENSRGKRGGNRLLLPTRLSHPFGGKSQRPDSQGKDEVCTNDLEKGTIKCSCEREYYLNGYFSAGPRTKRERLYHQVTKQSREASREKGRGYGRYYGKETCDSTFRPVRSSRGGTARKAKREKKISKANGHGKRIVSGGKGGWKSAHLYIRGKTSR